MCDRDGHHHRDHGGEAVGQLADTGAAAMSRPFGRKPCGSRRHRQVSRPAPAGPAVSAVTLRRWSRLQRPGLTRPPCLASSRRARSQSRALPPVASSMALRATLECDLPRQDLGTYRKDGTESVRSSLLALTAA